jgi:hypothetical protein
MQAVPSSVAWELTDHGDVIRITDGGARSSRVWLRSRSQSTFAPGIARAMTAVDEHSAYLTVLIPSTTRPDPWYVHRRLQDPRRGATWQPSIVPLKAG